MKTAWLLRGTGGSNTDYFWFEDTKNYLESKGYEVWWPLLPHTESPDLDETKSFIQAHMPLPDADTIIIGHSSACPLILDMLQSLTIKAKQVILVSGYYQSISDEANKMLPQSFDWEKISSNAAEIVCINSDNDPWGCDDKQARPAAEKLGTTFILAEGQGHMGSGTFNQPYREFALLKGLVDSTT